jgi:putative flippase GtrA
LLQLKSKMKKEFLLYAAVSAFALALDLMTLGAITALSEIPSYIATAVAYSVGLAAHYFLAVGFVFKKRRMRAEVVAEAGIYAATGIAGMLISAAIVYIGSLLDQSLAVSKITAVIVSFLTIFAFRKAILFTTEKPKGYKS